MIEEIERSKTNVLIADDHPLIRRAIKEILDSTDDITVVGEAQDGEEVIKQVDEFLPNLVILDIGMPKLNGLVVTLKIKEKHPQIAVLILTVYDDDEHVITALKNGAAGYLTKDVLCSEILTAVRAIVAGESILSHSVLKSLVAKIDPIETPKDRVRINEFENLSIREIEVYRLLTQGLTNKQIAEKLNLSTVTVKRYLADIFAKLEVSSRTEAVIKGFRMGLVKIDDIKQ